MRCKCVNTKSFILSFCRMSRVMEMTIFVHRCTTLSIDYVAHSSLWHAKNGPTEQFSMRPVSVCFRCIFFFSANFRTCTQNVRNIFQATQIFLLFVSSKALLLIISIVSVPFQWSHTLKFSISIEKVCGLPMPMYHIHSLNYLHAHTRALTHFISWKKKQRTNKMFCCVT